MISSSWHLAIGLGCTNFCKWHCLHVYEFTPACDISTCRCVAWEKNNHLLSLKIGIVTAKTWWRSGHAQSLSNLHPILSYLSQRARKLNPPLALTLYNESFINNMIQHCKITLQHMTGTWHVWLKSRPKRAKGSAWRSWPQQASWSSISLKLKSVCVWP